MNRNFVCRDSRQKITNHDIIFFSFSLKKGNHYSRHFVVARYTLDQGTTYPLWRQLHSSHPKADRGMPDSASSADSDRNQCTAGSERLPKENAGRRPTLEWPRNLEEEEEEQVEVERYQRNDERRRRRQERRNRWQARQEREENEEEEER